MSAVRLAARLEMLGLHSIASAVECGADRFRCFALLERVECCPQTYQLAFDWIEGSKV